MRSGYDHPVGFSKDLDTGIYKPILASQKERQADIICPIYISHLDICAV